MIAYWLFRAVIFIFKLLPFPIVYFISDVSYFFIRFVFSYRKKVILSNLKNSFPDKNEKEIKKICGKFYRHLSDLIFETIKAYSLSPKKLLKRSPILNLEVDKEYFDKGKNVIYAGGHYGNWEWGTRFAPLQLFHKAVIMYKPIENKYIDKYINKLRSKDGAKMVSIYYPGKFFSENKESFGLIMVGDQNPSNKHKAIWVNFLNQPTACLHGIELYAKKFRLPVVYFSIKKVKRGVYHSTLVPIVDDPSKAPKGYITWLYMKHLEKDIQEHPEYWLWSHKRWKHEYSDEFKIFDFKENLKKS